MKVSDVLREMTEWDAERVLYSYVEGGGSRSASQNLDNAVETLIHNSAYQFQGMMYRILTFGANEISTSTNVSEFLSSKMRQYASEYPHKYFSWSKSISGAEHAIISLLSGGEGGGSSRSNSFSDIPWFGLR